MVMDKAEKVFADDLESRGVKPAFELNLDLEKIRSLYEAENVGGPTASMALMKIYKAWRKATGITDKKARECFHTCIMEAMMNVVENTPTDVWNVRCYVHDDKYYLVFKDKSKTEFDIESAPEMKSPLLLLERGRGLQIIKSYAHAYSRQIKGENKGVELYLVNPITALPKK